MDCIINQLYDQSVTSPSSSCVGPGHREPRQPSSSNSHRTKQICCLFTAHPPASAEGFSLTGAHWGLSRWHGCYKGAAGTVPTLQVRKYALGRLGSHLCLVNEKPARPDRSRTLGPPRLISLLWPWPCAWPPFGRHQAESPRAPLGGITPERWSRFVAHGFPLLA